MTTTEVAQILAAVARVDEQCGGGSRWGDSLRVRRILRTRVAKIKGLAKEDATAAGRLDKVEGRVTWLDRVAYTALGAGVTSWLPDLAALIP